MEIFAPTDEVALAAMVAEAARRGTPLRIRGGGTRLSLGNPVEAKAELHLSGLTGITLYEPAALTIGARAGTPIAGIEAALAAEGQHLPFEPADWRRLLGSEGEPTIGGAIACGVSGPRRIQAGSARDAAIGMRFVDGTGAIVRNGGRVMKNVTGYDLVKLMCGAFGTLGVLAEIVFKVLPRPEAASTLVLQGLDDARAIAALSAALASPFDVNGAAHLPEDRAGQTRTCIRVEGFVSSVKYRMARLQEILAPFGEAEILSDPQAHADIWRSVRDVEAFGNRDGAVWKLSLRPSHAPALVAALRAELDLDAMYDWGGGLVWLLTPQKGDTGASLIRGAVAARGGHATLMRARQEIRRTVPAFQPEAPAIAAISRGIRARFDPAGIFNPGLIDSVPVTAAQQAPILERKWNS